MKKAIAVDALAAPGEISGGVRSSANDYLVGKGYAWYSLLSGVHVDAF